MIRTPLVLSLSILVPWAVAGCTSQPLAPSAQPSGASASQLAARPVGGASRATVTPPKGGRPASPGVVYVTSQGLYYDTFVTANPLPMNGPFQRLENGETEFGPGDPGYLGGRWWVDANHNGMQDAGDDFFLCPLTPPGRPTP